MILIESVHELEEEIAKQQADLIVLDLDNTVIEPFFPIQDLIEDLKELGKEDLVSEWRLGRKIILTDPNWPVFIQKNQGKTIAVTQVETGQYGLIQSVEKWRYQELKTLGITFAEATGEPKRVGKGSYYGGIYCTGKGKKLDLLELILKKEKAILVVDDKRSQLEAILNLNYITVTALLFKSQWKGGSLPDFEKSFFIKIIRSDLPNKIKEKAKKFLEPLQKKIP